MSDVNEVNNNNNKSHERELNELKLNYFSKSGYHNGYLDINHAVEKINSNTAKKLSDKWYDQDDDRYSSGFHKRKDFDYLKESEHSVKNETPQQQLERQLEIAQKAGYVDGVCHCVALLDEDRNLVKKLLTEMNVTKDMAKKYAAQETYQKLEKINGIFAEQQKLERTQGRKL